MCSTTEGGHMCCRQKTDTVLYEKVQRATRRRQVSLDSRPAEGEDEVYEPAGPSSSSHTHTSAHLVHLLLVNQLGGVHKVLAIKQDDSGCNCTCSTPEHHISQGLCPCITWKADSRHLIIIIRNTFRLLLCKPSSF